MTSHDTPKLLVLTDRRAAEVCGQGLVACVRAALAGGPFDLLLREKDMPRPERAALGIELRDALGDGGRLIVASDAGLARELRVAGVHLAAADPAPATTFGAEGYEPLLGRSCHGREELRQAAEAGHSYATLSPVHASRSKPGHGPALGLDALAEACAGTRLPVLALGGVDPTTAPGCLAAGAAGLAVMGAVMRASDPAAVVAALLESLADHGASPSGATAGGSTA